MTTFSPEAQQLFDRYLQTVRWSVRGVGDAEEIEHDVREHVSSALGSQDTPVSSATLREVLSRLGDPWQWVSPEDLPLWRRVLMRFSLGPEDWRLAYTCFGLTLLGMLLMPVGIGLVFLIAAYLLGRATYDLAKDRDGTLGPRRWLVYPPLAFFSAMIAIFILVGPIAPLMAWGVGDHGFEMMARGFQFDITQSVERAFFYGAAIAISFGAWWIVLSGLTAVLIRPLRWILTPFANGLRRVHVLLLTGIGAVAVATGAAILSNHPR